MVKGLSKSVGLKGLGFRANTVKMRKPAIF